MIIVAKTPRLSNYCFRALPINLNFILLSEVELLQFLTVLRELENRRSLPT